MEFSKSPFGWWCNVALKCVFSCVAAGALLSSLELMKLWYNLHPPVKIGGNEPSAWGELNDNPGARAHNDNVFWPQFLGSEHSLVHQVTVNGVQITSQAWDTPASGRDVIAYYRGQMTARGWQDVTEETLQLNQHSGTGGDGAQNVRDIMVYRSTTDSDLILNRGRWSMQVTTFPDKERTGLTTVSICAASTPSLQDFFAQLSSTSGKDALQGGRPLDMVQQTGNSTYHMMIANQDASPAQAFQEALSDAEAKGWSPVVLPNQRRTSRSFTWMTKGADYAALLVSPSREGAGSVVTFIQVTTH